MRSSLGKISSPWRLLSISLILGPALLSPFSAKSQGRNVQFGSDSASPRRDWDYDGNRILGHIGRDIYLWDAATGKVLQKFLGHRESIQSLQFSPGGAYILSSTGVRQVGDTKPDCGSVDTNTRLWDASTGKELWKKQDAFAGTFSPDGKRILLLELRTCIDTPATITMWDVSGRKLFQAKGGDSFSAVYTRVAFSPNGHRFAAESYNDEASLYDADTGKKLKTFKATDDIHFYGTSGDIETSSARGVEVWSSSGQLLRRINLTGGNAHRGVWSSDGSYMADVKTNNFSTWKGILRLWDVKSGQTKSIDIGAHSLTSSPVDAVALLWKGGGEASDSRPLQFAMYDLVNGDELWHGRAEAYSFLGFAPDGKTFLVGGGPNFVVFSTKTGKALSKVDLLGTCQGDGLGAFGVASPVCSLKGNDSFATPN